MSRRSEKTTKQAGTRRATRASMSSNEAREAKIEALRARLEQAVSNLDNGDNWIEWLTFVAQFGRKYSMSNQMLIMLESAARGFEPKLVKSFGAWFREARHEKGCSRLLKTCRCRDLNVPVRPQHMDRNEPFGLPIWAPIKRKLRPEECERREAKSGKRIARDEKGYSLNKELAGFGIEYVFDVSQLRRPDEVEVPEPLAVRRRMRTAGPRPVPQLLAGEDTTGALAEVVALIESHGLTFEYVDPSVLDGANGRTNGQCVQVRSDVDDAQKVKTAIHELAHNLCGHTDTSYNYVAHRGRAETEAESVAYVVCGALGLDTVQYSAPYVSGWSKGDVEAIRGCAETVTRVAGEILDALDPAEPEASEAPETLEMAA